MVDCLTWRQTSENVKMSNVTPSGDLDTQVVQRQATLVVPLN